MRQALFGRFKARVRISAWRIGVAVALQAGCLGLALVLGGAPALAQTLASLPAPTQTLDRTGSARPVAAWANFCERYPAECAIDVSEPAVLTLTPEVWRAIMSVNRRVNKRIKPMTDLSIGASSTSWDFPDDGYGDCEDYQLLKRKLLVEQACPGAPCG